MCLLGKAAAPVEAFYSARMPVHGFFAFSPRSLRLRVRHLSNGEIQ